MKSLLNMSNKLLYNTKNYRKKVEKRSFKILRSNIDV